MLRLGPSAPPSTRPWRTRTAVVAAASLVGSALVVGLGSTGAAAAPPTCLSATESGTFDNGDGTTSIVLAATTTATIASTSTATIPVGVTEVRFDVCGAQGEAGQRSAGGLGGRTTGTLTNNRAVSRDLVLLAGTSDGSRGFGGQGMGGAGNGGGLSGIFSGTVSQAGALAVAGGGGGGAANDVVSEELLGADNSDGGAGGGPTGDDGEGPLGGTLDEVVQTTGGGGGTQTAPGRGGPLPGTLNTTPLSTIQGKDGQALRGGDGADAAPLDLSNGTNGGGGGGGGGYFGGGGGGSVLAVPNPIADPLGDPVSGGGGGGSGFLRSTSVLPASTTTTGAGGTGNGAVVLTFTTPAAPRFTDRVDGTATAGSPFSSTGRATGSPPPSFTVLDPQNLPPGLTFRDNGNGTYTISGTPTTPGTYTFTIRATNESGFADLPQTIVVAAAPVITAPASATPTSTTSPSASPSGSPSPSASASPRVTPSATATATMTPTPTASPARSVTGRYHPVTPARILDTRTDRSRVSAGSDREVQITGRGGVPTTGVTAVVLNVTVTQASARGDLQVYPTGQRPTNRTSNLNFFAGETVPVQVQTGVGSNGRINLSLNTGSADVIVDVFGYYGDASDALDRSSGYTELQPQRLLDTRESRSPVRAGADRTVRVTGLLGVPANATAVVLNTTVLGTPANADLQVYPTGSRPTQRTSNLNVRRGQTKANSVTTPIGSDGSINLSISQNSAQVVLDVLGYYSVDSRGRFVALTPERIFDTRTNRDPVRAGADRVVRVGGRGGVPAGARAAVLSVTGTGASNPVDLQVFPTGNRPSNRTSTINFRPGEAIANVAIATLGTDDSVSLSLSRGSAAVVLDVVGYFTEE